MDRLKSALSESLSLFIKICGLGVILVIFGRVTDLYPITVVGGLMMAPLTVMAGLACLAVVLLAPAWPLGALSDRVSTRWQKPFVILAIVAVLGWWALWGFIATGALADH